MMSLGKPRQQTLPVPMKLVGYLPILEITDKDKQAYFDALEAFDSNIFKNLRLNKIMDPNDEALNLLKQNLKELFKTYPDIDKACQSRIKHWNDNWDKNPQVGIPALTD